MQSEPRDQRCSTLSHRCDIDFPVGGKKKGEKKKVLLHIRSR